MLPTNRQLQDVLTLAGLERPGWERTAAELRASGTPLNEAVGAQNPVLGPEIDGVKLTVDMYLNPPTRIPAIIRNLVAENEGYFIEEIFATPGFTVEGGAIIYEETFPEDHFLPEDQSIAPRAPGSKAPRLGTTIRPPKLAKPESYSGSIEVHDEARRRNQVRKVQKQFTQAANTFADRLQTRGMEVLAEFAETSNRQIAGMNWRQARPLGVPNADPTTLPHVDIAKVLKQFVKDKAGQRPSVMVINPEDAFFLDVIYGDKLPALLQRYNLRLRESVAAPEGAPYFVKAGGIGVIAFEVPLSQEKTRDGEAKTDVFTLESVPVFVADDASAIIQLVGVNDS